MLIDIAKDILKNKHLCNHCLGRQFAQILSGLTNEERGKFVRHVLAFEYSVKPFPIDISNFYGLDFRSKKIQTKQKKCDICNDIFKTLDILLEKTTKKIKEIEFKTFVIGTKLSKELIGKEESLWEECGIEYCEPLKSEINREFGKLFQKTTKKEVDEENPDVTIILDFSTNNINAQISSLYFYGKYKKLVRGIPQTKWEKYKITIEDIIAKPFMLMTKGNAHALHGAGREDIDARCLDWRPFVLEINNPKIRKIDIKKTEKTINKTKKVLVSGLRPSNRKEVVKVKNLQPDKTYRVLVEFEKPIKEINLKRLTGTIKQHTPKRVLHRRADKLRLKKVKTIKWKKITGKKLEFIIRGEAGLYVKEFITGDDGRTKPSVAELLNSKAKVKELDVIKIHL